MTEPAANDTRQGGTALEEYPAPAGGNVVEATLAMGETPPLFNAPSAGAASPEALLHLPYEDARRELLDDFERRYVERPPRSERRQRVCRRARRADRPHRT